MADGVLGVVRGHVEAIDLVVSIRVDPALHDVSAVQQYLGVVLHQHREDAGVLAGDTRLEDVALLYVAFRDGDKVPVVNVALPLLVGTRRLLILFGDLDVGVHRRVLRESHERDVAVGLFLSYLLLELSLLIRTRGEHQLVDTLCQFQVCHFSRFQQRFHLGQIFLLLLKLFRRLFAHLAISQLFYDFVQSFLSSLLYFFPQVSFILKSSANL